MRPSAPFRPPKANWDRKRLRACLLCPFGYREPTDSANRRFSRRSSTRLCAREWSIWGNCKFSPIVPVSPYGMESAPNSRRLLCFLLPPILPSRLMYRLQAIGKGHSLSCQSRCLRGQSSVFAGIGAVSAVLLP